MTEYVILVGSMSNSTSTSYLRKRYCMETQTMCHLATDFGYCSLSACIKMEKTHYESCDDEFCSRAKKGVNYG